MVILQSCVNVYQRVIKNHMIQNHWMLGKGHWNSQGEMKDSASSKHTNLTMQKKITDNFLFYPTQGPHMAR